MSDLNPKLLQTLTELSRIGITDNEKVAFLKDLKKILDYADQLKELDTEGVRPCHQVLSEMQNVEREDETGPTLDRATFLSNAPDHTGGMIRVPSVIKKR